MVQGPSISYSGHPNPDFGKSWKLNLFWNSNRFSRCVFWIDSELYYHLFILPHQYCCSFAQEHRWWSQGTLSVLVISAGAPWMSMCFNQFWTYGFMPQGQCSWTGGFAAWFLILIWQGRWFWVRVPWLMWHVQGTYCAKKHFLASD